MKFLNTLLKEQIDHTDPLIDNNDGPDLIDLGWKSFDTILNRITKYLKRYENSKRNETLLRRFKIFLQEEFIDMYYFYDPNNDEKEKELMQQFNWISNIDPDNFYDAIVKLGKQLDELEAKAQIFSREEAYKVMS